MKIKEDKASAWMQTYTGIKFHPLDPKLKEINIEDVAHGLSNMCRFNGQCNQFYSVAQHSVYVSRMVEESGLALQGLLHDASEAYIADIITCMKPFLVNYKTIEENLMGVIAKRFKFDWPMHTLVDIADKRVLVTEKECLLKSIDGADWEIMKKYSSYDELEISPMTPKQAKQEFLNRYNELCLN